MSTEILFSFPPSFSFSLPFSSLSFTPPPILYFLRPACLYSPYSCIILLYLTHFISSLPIFISYFYLFFRCPSLSILMRFYFVSSHLIFVLFYFLHSLSSISFIIYYILVSSLSLYPCLSLSLSSTFSLTLSSAFSCRSLIAFPSSPLYTIHSPCISSLSNLRFFVCLSIPFSLLLSPFYFVSQTEDSMSDSNYSPKLGGRQMFRTRFTGPE